MEPTVSKMLSGLTVELTHFLVYCHNNNLFSRAWLITPTNLREPGSREIYITGNCLCAFLLSLMLRRWIPRMKALSGPPGGAESNPAIIPGKRIGRSCRAIPGSERRFSEGRSRRVKRRGVGGVEMNHKNTTHKKNNNNEARALLLRKVTIKTTRFTC